MKLCTGIDTIEIARPDEINPTIRERFIQRVFHLLRNQPIPKQQRISERALCRQGSRIKGPWHWDRLCELAG